MNKNKLLSILGSTGTIGVNALEIKKIDTYYNIYALTANNNSDLLLKQAKKFTPEFIVIANESKYSQVKSELFGSGIKILSGKTGLLEVASKATDVTLSAISGSDGIEPSVTSINNTKNLALANKETIVSMGKLLFDKDINKTTKIIPVDSEHNSIFNLLQKIKRSDIREIILTASGGPFLNTPINDLRSVNATDALKHPTWSMGKKISIDSATLINKGLELIEATHLFDLDEKIIHVIIHPQSNIHAMVSLKDGSTYAHMSNPDMKIPISNAIFWPEKQKVFYNNLNFERLSQLTFSPIDNERFPAIILARESIKRGDIGPIVYNISSEIAVTEFLSDKIHFYDIYEIIKKSLDHRDFYNKNLIRNVDDVLLLHKNIKSVTRDIVSQLREQ